MADHIYNEVSNKNETQEKDGKFPKARHIFGVIAFFGFFLVYSMRVNLSVAIVTMVNQTAISKNHNSNSTLDEQTCPVKHSSSNATIKWQHEGEFNWDEPTQGLVLGSFYYGYVVTQIPSGRAAEIYGAKLIYGMGVLICGILSVLTPFIVRWNLWAFFGVRLMLGLAEGVTYPAIHVMLSHWIPPMERSTFSSLVYCGNYIGSFVAMPLSGWLCSMEFLDGWPLAFYIPGICGIIWFFFWMRFVYELPSTHPRISPDERSFIESAVKFEQRLDEDVATPWLTILTCRPLWAIIVTQFGWTWMVCLLLTELPTYMDQILHYDVQSNSFVSGLPFLTTYIMGYLCCQAAEWLLKNTKISLVNSYRLWNSIGTIIPALGLIGVAHVGCSGVWVMVMLAGLGSFGGAIFASIQLNHINLSPKYAGTMYAITNTTGFFAGFLAPYVVGLIISGNNTLHQWRIVFYLGAALSFVGNLFYLKFVSVEPQGF